MSAASPKLQDPRISDSRIPDKAAEKAHEPSMEEILASIRRIIADDQAARPAEPAQAFEPEPDDVLDLAEAAEPVARPAARAVPAEPAPLDLDDAALDFAEPESEPEPAPPPPLPRQAAPRPAPPRPAAQAPAATPDAAPAEEPEPLISRATDASVNSAFNLLAHTVLSQNARTLEDLVKDMLRPMLKAWLDDNLPAVVERLVRAEIERVSRGR